MGEQPLFLWVQRARKREREREREVGMTDAAGGIMRLRDIFLRDLFLRDLFLRDRRPGIRFGGDGGML
jgi:hypothetical protein